MNFSLNGKSALVSTCLLLGAFFVEAQTPVQEVRGKVVDAETRLALPGANVVVLNTDPLLGATTGEDGTFRIAAVPVGRHTFKVTYVGYKPVVIPEILVSSGKQTVINTELEALVVTSGEVEIKAAYDKDKPLNAMATVSARSFSVEESRRYAGSLDDPMRAVSNFAGVASNSGVNSNQIMIRGNSPKGLLWKVEGVDIPNPNHFAFVGTSGGGFTIFSSQVLANSDFYTAAFPAQYGNAISGVFDMRFRNGNNARHEYGIQLGLQGLDVAAEGPFTKKHTSSYLFNYRYSVLGFLKYIDPSLKNSLPEFQDISFKLNFPTRKAGTFSLLGIGGMSTIRSVPEEDTAKWTTLDARSKTDLNNKMGAVALIHLVFLSRNTYIRTSLSTTYNDIVVNDNLMVSADSMRPVDSVKHQNYRVTAAVMMNNKFGPRYTLRSGISYTQMYFNIGISAVNPFTGIFGSVTKGDGNTGLVQAFTEAKTDLSNNFYLATGISFQYFTLNGRYAVEPRIAGFWQVTRRHALSFGYGMHSQSEDIGIYLAGVPLENGATGQPNRNMDLSRAHHFVLGYDFSVRSDIRFKAEAYYQYLYSIPVMPGSFYSMINSTGGYFSDTLVNRGTGRNVGLDLTFEKFLTKQYYYMVTASIFDSKYKGGDHIVRNTRFNSNYVVNLLGGKEWTVRKKNLFGVNLKMVATGGEYYVPIDLEQSIAQHREVLDEPAAYTRRLPSFFYIDLTLTYRTNHKKFSGIWAIQVRNLLNQRPVTGYLYNDYNQSIEPVKSLGIIPLLSYKVEF
jgi:hypothetical protein